MFWKQHWGHEPLGKTLGDGSEVTQLCHGLPELDSRPAQSSVVAMSQCDSCWAFEMLQTELRCPVSLKSTPDFIFKEVKYFINNFYTHYIWNKLFHIRLNKIWKLISLLSKFFNVSSKKFKITYMSGIVFLWNRAGPGHLPTSLWLLPEARWTRHCGCQVQCPGPWKISCGIKGKNFVLVL